MLLDKVHIKGCMVARLPARKIDSGENESFGQGGEHNYIGIFQSFFYQQHQMIIFFMRRTVVRLYNRDVRVGI
jgi:hypothetical protein